MQVPLMHTWPVAEQHALPHGVCPCVQAATAVAHVEVEAFAHAVPFWQHAEPQGVVPAWQPHRPVVRSTHATPALQQHGPHGVAPAAQGELPRLVGPEQVGAGAAVPLTGLTTAASAAPAAAMPNILSRPRRLCGAAIALVRSSNRSLMASASCRLYRVKHPTPGSNASSSRTWQHLAHARRGRRARKGDFGGEEEGEGEEQPLEGRAG